MASLMDENALRKRIYDVYYRMKVRARPRQWKTGKRAGAVRKPGLDELPFTREDLWHMAQRAVGVNGAVRCPYCEAIGRPVNMLDLRNIVFDHFVPLDRGGTWDLSNIRCCCEDCNRQKGSMTFEFFVAIARVAEQWTDAKDRNYLYACLRTHGVSIKMRFGGKPKPEPTQPSPQLQLEEPF